MRMRVSGVVWCGRWASGLLNGRSSVLVPPRRTVFLAAIVLGEFLEDLEDLDDWFGVCRQQQVAGHCNDRERWGRCMTVARVREPLRTWAVLVGLVLLAHGVLLTQARVVFDVRDASGSQAWVTRSLVMTPPPPPEALPAAPEAPRRRAVAPRLRPPPEASAVSESVQVPQGDTVPVPDAPPQEAPASEPVEMAVQPSGPETTSTTPALDAAIQHLLPTVQARPVAPVASPFDIAAAAPVSLTPATGVVSAVTLPGSVRLLYQLTGESRGRTYHARGELLWRHDGQVYEARLEVSAFLIGSRAQSSRGRVGPAGLVPERFGDKSRSEQAAHFDWERARVVFSANTPEAVLAPGAQDRLSVMLQLAARVAGEPERYRVGTQLQQQTVSARESEVWTLSLESAESLELPGGELQTLKWLRQPRRPFDPRVEVWLAPQLGYLPARIRITQANGDYIDQQWKGSEAP